MSDLIIYGASDDLIEFEGVLSDEISEPSGKAVLSITEDGSPLAKVVAEYGPDGIWRFSAFADDVVDVRVVGWRGEDEGDDEDGCPGYSEKLLIACVEGSDVKVRVAPEVTP